jgi:hypothetical protein
MKLDAARCAHLLERSDRGVLATRHPTRGVDAVPVCFAVGGGRVAIPIDRVKPKATTDLQRTRNLKGDGRATLLCDHWDGADWSRLWWVRVSLVWVPDGGAARPSLEPLLCRKYRQYEDLSFADLLLFEIRAIAGWSAGPSGPDRPE